jgi:hypothetical protein
MLKLAPSKFWKKRGRKPKNLSTVNMSCLIFMKASELTVVGRQLSERDFSARISKCALLNHTTDFGDYRWTVDTPEDLEFMRQVYSRFDGRDDFSWKEVLDLVHNEPALMEINAGVKHKTLKDIDKESVETLERLKVGKPASFNFQTFQPSNLPTFRMPLITLFSAPKPFTDPHIALIQRNALHSWTLLPGC